MMESDSLASDLFDWSRSCGRFQAPVGHQNLDDSIGRCSAISGPLSQELHSESESPELLLSSADSEGPDDYESTVSSDSDLEYFDELNESIDQDPSESEGTPEPELLQQTESVLSSELHQASKTPLYNGSHITIFQSFLLIFQFAVRHSLTTKAFGELLHLIAAHLPQAAQCPKSVSQLKKFFISIFPEAKTHEQWYCSCCQQLLRSDHDVCHRQGCKTAKPARFVMIPLEQQLKRIMEDGDTWKDLQSRFSQRNNDTVIRDVWDGSEYRKHSAFLSQPTHISFQLNTDGVALFKSSKVNFWPVWLVINELPKARRYLKRNMILAALWYDREKPSMTTLLKPLIDTINNIYHNGVEIACPLGRKLAKAMLLLCTVDLPARALVLNMKHFNGICGCSYCEDTGQTDSPLHRFWPFTGSMVLRTHHSVMDNAKKAHEDGTAVKGVKGPSILCIHQPFDVVRGVAIDSLHCIYLGVTVLLFKLWFHKDNKRADYYIGDKVDLCNKRLLGIKVPDTFSRIPKSITPDVGASHWKGSELRAWLLYFSIPVLGGILAPCYMVHFSLLVTAIHILSSDGINLEDLETATELLAKFYRQFSDLYGCEHATMNIHMLIHLPQCVQCWGPLWAYSCFPFESMNGQLKSLYHGSRDMSNQLVFSYVIMQWLPRLALDNLPSLSRIRLVQDMLLGKRRIKRQLLHDNVWAIGGTALMTLGADVLQCVNQYLSQHNIQLSATDRVACFYRVQINGQIFYSARYGRVVKRNSFTVFFFDGSEHMYGHIQYFLYLNTAAFAVIKQLQCCSSTLNLFALPTTVRTLNETIVPTVTSDIMHCVPLSAIQQKCLYMQLPGHSVNFVARLADIPLMD